MSPAERINWYNSSLFNKPINFTKEIDNTIYTVNTHFNESSTESIEEKTVRILEQTEKTIAELHFKVLKYNREYVIIQLTCNQTYSAVERRKV